MVNLIDFVYPERNQFQAINQFRVDAPGCVKGFIILDIVLFVNGLPLVVVEAKIADRRKRTGRAFAKGNPGWDIRPENMRRWTSCSWTIGNARNGCARTGPGWTFEGGSALQPMRVFR